MKRIVIIVLLLAMLACLVGCSSVDYGMVKEKSFIPAHRIYQPIIMISGMRTQVIPRWIRHEASWEILVENDKGRNWWYVSEDYFNSVNVGDYVDRRNR